MLKRMPEAVGRRVTVIVDGAALEVSENDSVAATLLAAGKDHVRRHPVTLAPRAPYCFMGVCFECLVTIDGVGNRQSCMVPVREGMVIETQQGRREAGR
ncbi:MAG: (2Fe-2S)-binding protein [Hyphomicrobiaceae bacterium]